MLFKIPEFWTEMRILILVLLTTLHSFGQGAQIKIAYDSDLKDYEILKGQLDNYKVFFDGETHNVSSNEVRHFNFFKYLYFNNGVKYFIKEYDFEIGFYVNKYIQTGDKEWLKFWIPSKEAEEFYYQLYQFNNSLPADRKILFVSIDAYSFKNTDKFITNLTLGKGEQVGTVKEAIEILKTIKRIDSKGLGMDIQGKDKAEIIDKLKIVRKLVHENSKTFIDYFKEDYLFFHLTVFNKASEKRDDDNLTTNFLEFSKIENKGNYYLYYGNLHCQLNSKWFAGLVNKTVEFGGQVCSFTSQYRDSQYWFYEPKSQTDFGVINSGEYSKKIIDRLVNESKTDCTLFPAKYIGQGIEKGTDFIFFLRNQKAIESYYKRSG